MPLDAVAVIALVVAEQFVVEFTVTVLLPPVPTNGVIDTPIGSPVTKPLKVCVATPTVFVEVSVVW